MKSYSLHLVKTNIWDFISILIGWLSKFWKHKAFLEYLFFHKTRWKCRGNIPFFIWIFVINIRFYCIKYLFYWLEELSHYWICNHTYPLWGIPQIFRYIICEVLENTLKHSERISIYTWSCCPLVIHVSFVQWSLMFQLILTVDW